MESSSAVETVLVGNGTTVEREEYKGEYVCGAPEERERRKADIDTRQLQARCERLQLESASLLGARWLSCDWENYQTTDANRRGREAAERWLKSPDSNLIISGPVGAGKTHLMACACRHLLKEGWTKYRSWGSGTEQGDPTLYWFSAPEWIALVKRGFGSEDYREDATSKLVDATKSRILFLDDLGKVHPGSQGSSWLEEQFYHVVDPRYRNALPTVVTTEWTREALGERVGVSVVSRLMDGAIIAPLGEYEWRRPLEQG